MNMSWNYIGDWAEEMDERVRKQRRARLKIAAKHFGLDILDVLGDLEIEERLLARYEESGLEWPPLEDLEV
jgi:hypothetical protein